VRSRPTSSLMFASKSHPTTQGASDDSISEGPGGRTLGPQIPSAAVARLLRLLLAATVATLLLAGIETRHASAEPQVRTPTSAEEIIGAARCPEGSWDTTPSGMVLGSTGCPVLGNLSSRVLNKPIVGMGSTPDGGGYWLVASDGGVFAFGDARFYGSTGSLKLNEPIVGMASTPDGGGYWLVASDGGVFTFGDARFHGSTGSLKLNKPIVGMASTPDGGGYWLVASDGGVFTFGDARFHGSTGSLKLNKPIVGMASTADGDGYWLVGSDGGVFTFGDARFHGSMALSTGYQAISILGTPTGYEIISNTGAVTPFVGSTPLATSPTRPIGDNAPIPRVIGNTLETSTGQPLRLLGFDADGTDDACTSDLGFSWGGENLNEAFEIAAWHTNAVRVPINEDCWLGINGVPPQYSGEAYQNAIQQWVRDLNAAGLVAIIDLHLTAPSSYESTFQWPMADEDHAPLVWEQIGADFSYDPSVVFDLYNEPFIGGGSPTVNDWQCWEYGCEISFNTCSAAGSTICTTVEYQTAGMQQLVTIVRDEGATEPIMLGGLNYSADLCAPIAGQPSGAPCAWLAFRPTDPLNELIASFHTYDWTACADMACWNSQIAPVATSVPVVTGEFGESDCTPNFMNSYMNWADAHNVSYLAWAWEAPNGGDPLECLPSANGANTNVNLKLLNNWSGQPSTRAPQGQAFADHLAALAGA
jgi:hypothetical protein